MKKKCVKRIAAHLLLLSVVMTSACGAVDTTGKAPESVQKASIQEQPEEDAQTQLPAEPVTLPLRLQDPQKPAAKVHYVVTEHKSEEAEEFLWDCLSKYSPSDQITAGILAMFWRESFFRSDATAHWGSVLRYTNYDQPADFTAQIDAGLADGSTKELFVEQVNGVIGGYGLSMWYSVHLLESFYDFARERGTSIADAEMQCAFTLESMQDEEYEELWEQLLETNDPAIAGAMIARIYDGTNSGYIYISQMAELYYDKYAV